MKINIDSKNVRRQIENFWNHIHFHPTEAVNDLWGKQILNKVAEDQASQYVRLHTMFEDIVSRDEHGKLVFDFCESDQRLDFMVKQGFKLLLCFDFMPLCMSTDQRNISGLRYKNKVICRSAPGDYKEWAEVCMTYTRHLHERYGIDIIKNWYFHCWNEPDAGYWITGKDNDEWDAAGDTDKIDEYCKLYDYFEYGVSQVTDKVRIGGPSAAGSDRFIEGFIKHIKTGSNTVSGKTGTRFDFLSVHCYSQGIYSNLPNKCYASPENIIQRMRTLRVILDRNECKETEMLLDEWGICGGGFLGIDRDPRMIFRETEYFSAFYARLIELLANAPELKVTKMMICLSGQDHSKVDFDGYRTFFTANGFPKPIYNAYALCAKLGNDLLSFTTAEANPSVGVIPTRTIDGNVAILLYHFTDDYYQPRENVPVHCLISEIKGNYQLRHYRIDKEVSNAYTKWIGLGAHQCLSVWEKNMIQETGMLSLYYPEKTIYAEGEVSLDFVMTSNSISLLEFTKIV